MALILGTIAFQDMEIPERISGLGGRHALVVHKLVGGRRVIDAMGPDHGDPSWSGRMQGGRAVDRARAIDALRRSGRQVPFSWGGLFLTVVVSEFEYEPERTYQVLYRIRLLVVSDPSDGAAEGPASTLDDLVATDLAVAATLGAGLAGSVADAVAALSSAVASVPTLQGAPTGALAPVITAAGAATDAISTALNANDSRVASDTVGGVAPGDFPTDAVAAFQAQIAALTTGANLFDAGTAVGRLAANVAQSQG